MLPTIRVYETKRDRDAEAKLITLYCIDPPKGVAKWLLRLLEDKMVKLKYVESISHEPWNVKDQVIPPEKNSEFVANMEQVLAGYK